MNLSSNQSGPFVTGQSGGRSQDSHAHAAVRHPGSLSVITDWSNTIERKIDGRIAQILTRSSLDRSIREFLSELLKLPPLQDGIGAYLQFVARYFNRDDEIKSVLDGCSKLNLESSPKRVALLKKFGELEKADTWTPQESSQLIECLEVQRQMGVLTREEQAVYRAFLICNQRKDFFGDDVRLRFYLARNLYYQRNSSDEDAQLQYLRPWKIAGETPDRFKRRRYLLGACLIKPGEVKSQAAISQYFERGRSTTGMDFETVGFLESLEVISERSLRGGINVRDDIPSEGTHDSSQTGMFRHTPVKDRIAQCRRFALFQFVSAEIELYRAGVIDQVSFEAELGDLFLCDAAEVSSSLNDSLFSLSQEDMEYRNSQTLSSGHQRSEPTRERRKRLQALLNEVVSQLVDFKDTLQSTVFKSNAELGAQFSISEATLFADFAELDSKYPWFRAVNGYRSSQIVSEPRSAPSPRSPGAGRIPDKTVEWQTTPDSEFETIASETYRALLTEHASDLLNQFLDWQSFSDEELLELVTLATPKELAGLDPNTLLKILLDTQRKIVDEGDPRPDKEILKEHGLQDQHVLVLAKVAGRVHRAYHGCRFRTHSFDSAEEGAAAILLEEFLPGSFKLAEDDSLHRTTRSGKIIDFRYVSPAGKSIYIEYHPIRLDDPRRSASDFLDEEEYRVYLRDRATVISENEGDQGKTKTQLQQIDQQWRETLAERYAASRHEVATIEHEGKSNEFEVRHVQSADEVFDLLAKLALECGDAELRISRSEFTQKFDRLTRGLRNLRRFEEAFTAELERLYPHHYSKRGTAAKPGQLFRPLTAVGTWRLVDSQGTAIIPFLSMRGRSVALEIFQNDLNALDLCQERNDPGYYADPETYRQELLANGVKAVVFDASTTGKANMQAVVHDIISVFNLDEHHSELETASGLGIIRDAARRIIERLRSGTGGAAPQAAAAESAGGSAA